MGDPQAPSGVALSDDALSGPGRTGGRWSPVHAATAAIVVLVVAAIVIAVYDGGPSSSAARARTTANPARPGSVLPGPPGLLAGAEPQPNGYMWLLARSGGAETLQLLNLTTGKVTTVVPESLSADAVVQSPSGVLAVGLGSGSTGAVELRNGTSGALVATVPVGGPVKALATGSDGSSLYALVDGATASAVVLVDIETRASSVLVPVPMDTTAIAVQPTEQDLYALSPSGMVTEIAIGTGTVQADFPAGAGAQALAISPAGSTLDVLQRVGAACDVGIVDAATERQLRAVAAPADCVDVQVSPDGRSLYDVVGTSTYGNVQVFSLGT